ncbi:MAG: pyridoxamine kinase [Prevotellaceae bacterium]|nr:pyridoxamine kinase [Prevotellaceae bacterium]
MQRKELLIINDMCGYGKVATVAMLPVLSYLGIPTFNLPTAIVSNNLEYGKFNLLDTTEYMKGVFPVWKELGFSFGAIATGFIASEKQAEIVADYCSEQAQLGTTIFVDPIMGDEGKLYNGVTPSTILSMRRMVSVAHLIVPNYTEACYLTDTPYTNEPISLQEAYGLIDRLRRIGSRSVIITSMTIEQTSDNVGYTKAVVGYNAASEEYFTLPYHEIPVRFPGTGDIFSSVLFGNLLKGVSLEESTQKAMDVVAQMIFLSQHQEDKFRGIPIEKYLSLLS